eukprot:1763732-Prymnesium_polylepis.1
MGPVPGRQDPHLGSLGLLGIDSPAGGSEPSSHRAGRWKVHVVFEPFTRNTVRAKTRDCGWFMMASAKGRKASILHHMSSGG